MAFSRKSYKLTSDAERSRVTGKGWQGREEAPSVEGSRKKTQRQVCMEGNIQNRRAISRQLSESSLRSPTPANTQIQELTLTLCSASKHHIQLLLL